MLTIKSKKGVALQFLMELLVVVLFVVLMFAATSRLMSNESKFGELDTKNLALFLERIPSIEGNFIHKFSFYNKTTVQITNSEVQLTTDTNQYEHPYYNPLPYQITESFSGVTHIYFYKIGSEIYVTDKEDATLELKLQEEKIIEHEIPALNIIHKNAVGEPLSTIPNLKSEATAKTTILYVENYEDANTDIDIYFSHSARGIATGIYNEIINLYASNKEEITIGLIPDNSFFQYEIFNVNTNNEDKITIILNSQEEKTTIISGIGRYFN